MAFVLTKRAKKRAVWVARNALADYLRDNPASFCPFIVKGLLRNLREAVKLLDENTPNRDAQLKLSRVIAIWLTRSKRMTSLQRIFKLLSKEQRKQIKEMPTTFALVEAGLYRAPVDPIPDVDLQRLMLVQNSAETKIENLDLDEPLPLPAPSTSVMPVPEI